MKYSIHSIYTEEQKRAFLSFVLCILRDTIHPSKEVYSSYTAFLSVSFRLFLLLSRPRVRPTPARGCAAAAPRWSGRSGGCRRTGPGSGSETRTRTVHCCPPWHNCDKPQVTPSAPSLGRVPGTCTFSPSQHGYYGYRSGWWWRKNDHSLRPIDAKL